MSNSRASFFKIRLETQRGRRWAVAVAFLFPVFDFLFTFGDKPSILTLTHVVLLGGMLGGIGFQGPVKQFEAGFAKPFLNDEYDLVRRDHAHYVAYKFWRGVLMVGSFAFSVFHWLAAGTHAAHWHLFPIEQQIFEALIVPAALAFVFLPQAILLWTEEDIAPENGSGAGASVLTSSSSGLIL
jgi:hypothetical protein